MRTFVLHAALWICAVMGMGYVASELPAGAQAAFWLSYATILWGQPSLQRRDV